MVNQIEGYLGALTAVLCWGTYAVPTKFFKTGDGMVFQWIQCVAIWIVGLILQFSQGSPQFHPLAALGGVLWCLGNVTVVPIVGWIGLSLGMLVWGVTSMAIGWACGHFGLFGLKTVSPHPHLNIVGFVLAVISVGFYFPVQTKVKTETSEETVPINATMKSDYEGPKEIQGPRPMFKILGLASSVLAGVFYGFNMIPVSYLQKKEKNDNPLDYAFSHFSGILLCSTVLVAVYSGVKRNKPWVNNQLILPGFLSGSLWAIAQSAGFIANSNLGLATSFPILNTGPGVVGSIIGMVVFKEISGARNFGFLGCAFGLTFAGVLCIALSAS